MFHGIQQLLRYFSLELTGGPTSPFGATSTAKNENLVKNYVRQSLLLYPAVAFPQTLHIHQSVACSHLIDGQLRGC